MPNNDLKDYKVPYRFKGFEYVFNNLSMTLKMYKTIISFILLICFIINTALFLLFHFNAVTGFFNYSFDVFADGDFFAPFVAFFYLVKFYFVKTFFLYILELPIVLFFYPRILKYFKEKSENIVEDKFLRGTQILDEKNYITLLNKETAAEKQPLTFGDIKIPRKVENRHFLLIGRPGTGKTQTINQIIEKLRQRGEKAIIYDVKGDYLSYFYDSKTDYIFNPLDSRSCGWNLFNEIETAADVDSIATSLIPPSVGDGKFWVDAARDVFSAILHYLIKTQQTTMSDLFIHVSYSEAQLLELMQSAVENDNLEIAKRALAYLQGFSQGSKVASDVLSTMRQYTNSFYYVKHLENNFSIKKWLNEDESSFLFVTNYSNIKDTLKPILSLLIDIAMKHILSMSEDIDRRRFIFLDEFASLQYLTSIVNALEQSRSKGGSIWLATQDISQIQKLYGKETADTITNNANTILSFAVVDPNTQKFLSEVFGEKEYVESSESVIMKPDTGFGGINLNRREKKEQLVLPSEFGILEDFNFYLKMLSYPVTKSKITFKKFDKNNEPFILNPIFNINQK